MSRTTTAHPVTVIFAVCAAGLAVLLIMVLTHRPDAGVDPAAAPAPTTPSTATPAPPAVSSAAEPSAAETHRAADKEPGELPFSEVDAHDASPGATLYSQTEAARRQWQPVATGFGRAFTRTEGRRPAEWRSDLTPYVTEAVGDQLATVDVDHVPDGDFSGLEVAEYGEDKVAVYLHYDTGLTLVGYLIDDGSRWRLYAYDHWED